MKSMQLAGAVAGLVALAAAPSALAAPVTVDVRVEGPTRTLLEQRVTVDVRPFKFSDGAQTYTCDATGSGGTSATPVPTRNAALAQAAEQAGVELTGTVSSLGPSFERIGGESVAYDPGTFAYLVEYAKGVPAGFGGCNEGVAEGDEVLYAYGTGSEPLLRLAGPATVAPGAAATLSVTTGTAAVAGASVAGGTTDAGGQVTTAPLTQRGPVTFKATKAGSIRSSAVSVCVTDGADGFCGTSTPGAAPTPAAPVAQPDTVAAFAKIASVTEGKRFAKGRGPRTLAGRVDPEPAGIKDVRVRLSRTSGGRCTRYDGARERFVTTRKCGVKNAPTFSVGSTEAFSYLLPAKLPAGRYVLDVIVIDRAGHQTTTYQRGRNRVVFVVA